MLDQFINKTGKYWPLVEKVVIRGPFEILCKSGVTILDIPGTEDGNITLTARAEAAQAGCDKLFFLPKKETIKSKNTVNKLVEYSIVCPVALVITKLATSKYANEPKKASHNYKQRLLKEAKVHKNRHKFIQDLKVFVEVVITIYRFTVWKAMTPRGLQIQSLEIYLKNLCPLS